MPLASSLTKALKMQPLVQIFRYVFDEHQNGNPGSLDRIQRAPPDLIKNVLLARRLPKLSEMMPLVQIFR